MDFQNLLDLTFDTRLSTIPDIRWLPWVGKQFGKNGNRRLLIVGESHYAEASKTDTIEAVRAKHEANIDFTREILWESPVSGDIKIKTLDSISRLFLDSPDGKHFDFWQDVAFFNLVQRMMLYDKPPERPKREDFVTGWGVFWNVVNVLRPDYCVVLGSEAHHSFWYSMTNINGAFTDVKRTRQIGRYWGYSAAIIIDGQSIPISFVKHPGSYFSSSKWHAYLMEEFPAEMKALIKHYNA